jgi:CRP/FNR family transcriptional regulator
MPVSLPGLPRRDGSAPESLPCPACPGKSTNLCRPLAGKLQAEFFELATRQRWMPREVMFRAGDRAGPIFKITGGIAQVSRTLSGGQRQILRFLLPGDVCGYLSDDGRYTFDGEAITEVATCSFPRDGFKAFANRNAGFGEAIRTEMEEVLKEVGLHMTGVGQLSAPERVADFLLGMATTFEKRGLRVLSLRLPMSRADIGDYLGMRVETVSRAFTAMRRRRLIEIDGETVVILDKEGLATLVDRPAGP